MTRTSRRGFIILPASVSIALVLAAAVAGLIGTGLIYTALTDRLWGALVWGLPLTLAGLYWCGRALAQGQLSLRQRRLKRTSGAAGSPPHRASPDPAMAASRPRGTTHGRVH